MADFEALHGEPIIVPETSAVISLESIVAALAEVALEVKEGDEVVVVDKAGAIFRKQEDGAFHLKSKQDYVVMRSTYHMETQEERNGSLFGSPSSVAQ